MAICKCKMCGGDLNITELDKVVECEYCGTAQTVPSADNEKKMTLFNRANRLRSNNEFDKAAALYEQLVAEFPEEAEAYWGLCLCNYGIEYVDDPATGKKIPTCHRASFEKISADENFNLAMEYADVIAQRQYRAEAREIDRINEEILSVSRNETPYDIFICYKETDENGNRTVDSVMAQDIYDALTAKGYKVFFSRISLEDKLGQQYEPYIFAALNSAKIMLSVGTKYEYFHAVWVKNEWSRFLRLAAKDKRKVLIPCYKDIDPYDMPDEFQPLQAQDLGKLGAIQDLVRGIDKLLAKDAPAQPTPPAQVVVSNPAAATTESLLKRAFMFLEDGNWDSANEYAEKVLDIDPESGDAYLAKAMVDLHVKTRARLPSSFDFNSNSNIGKALRYGNETLKAEINGYVDLIPQAKEIRKMELAARRKELQNAQHLISAGSVYSVGVFSDGEVVSTRYHTKYDNFSDDHGQFDVDSWEDIVAIAAGYNQTVGVRFDGTVVSTKYVGSQKYYYGQCETDSWTDIIAVAAGHYHTVGLRSNGTVVSTKYIGEQKEYSGQCETDSWTDIIAIATGLYHTVGLRSDGTVIVTKNTGAHSWIDLYNKDLDSWRDIVAIDAKGENTVGLRSDGTVITTHDEDTGSWTDIVAVAAGPNHIVGLRFDGTVVSAGDNTEGQCETDSWTGIVAISAGDHHTIGLRSDGTVVATEFHGNKYENKGQCDTHWKLFNSFATLEEELRSTAEHAEERRIAAAKRAEEERIAVAKRAEEERLTAEKRVEEERLAAEKKAEEERQARIASLTKQKAALLAELPTLKGIFKANRAREVEAQLAEINAKLKQLGVTEERPMRPAPEAAQNPSPAAQTTASPASPAQPAATQRKEADEQEKQAAIQRAREAMLYEKDSLEKELPTLKGAFKASRRREVEARIAKLEENLKKLQQE